MSIQEGVAGGPPAAPKSRRTLATTGAVVAIVAEGLIPLVRNGGLELLLAALALAGVILMILGLVRREFSEPFVRRLMVVAAAALGLGAIIQLLSQVVPVFWALAREYLYWLFPLVGLLLLIVALSSKTPEQKVWIADARQRERLEAQAAQIRQFEAAYALAHNGERPPPGSTSPVAFSAVVSGQTNGLAVASLVLSLVGTGLLGAILGHVALSRIKRTGESGRGMAVAGISIGWVSFGLALAVVIAVAVVGLSHR